MAQIKEVTISKVDNEFTAFRKTGGVFARRKDKDTLVSYVQSRGWFIVEEFSKTAVNTQNYVPTKVAEFTVAERFDIMEKSVKMVGLGILPSAVIAGDAGMGKSYCVLDTLSNGCMKIEGEDYVIVKGYMTPKALYRKLWENRDRTLVFDDTDSILKDTVALNILKAALDSYSKRTISWLQEGFIPSDLPDSFDFTGSVIFISNLRSNKLDSALKTRSLMVDVSMELDEKIERMEDIVVDISPNTDIKIKKEVLEFIKKNKDYSTALSMRSMLKLIAVREEFPNDWENMALYFLSNE